MTRTFAALAAAVIATGARAQTPPPAQPAPSDAAPAAAAPAAPAPAVAAPAPAAPAAAAAPAAPKKPKGTFAIGPKSQILIQGRAWGEVNNVRADKGKGTSAVQNLSRFSNNSSYLRVRGERDLDHGFKAVAQVEAEVALDGENGIPFSGTRNTFVGLVSPYGELTIGKFDSPAKETTIGRDPFVGTGVFGYYNVMTAYRADRRLNNAVMYESPELEGLSLLAAFSLGEAKFAKKTTTVTVGTAPDTVKVSSSSTGTIRVDPYTASGALHYKRKTPLGPVFVGAAYEYRNDCSNPDADAPAGPSCDRALLGSDTQPNGVDQVIRVGADFTLNQTFTRLAAVYDHVSAKLTARNGLAQQKLDRDAYWASITQGVLSNKNQIILNYGVASKYSGTPAAGGSYDKTGAQTFTASYRYNFDSDMMIYAAVAQIMNDDGQTQKFGSGGVPGFSAPKGSTVTAFGAGMRYMF
jgi:predicted porin